jgi:hypothetical protein
LEKAAYVARDHQSTYARRQELAQEQGFRSYADKREQLQTARESELFRAQYPEGNARDPAYLKAVGIYNDAFGGKSRDYRTGSTLSQWFVEYAGIMTYEEWEELYG